MKKALFIGGLLVLGYFYKDKIFGTTKTPPKPQEPQEQSFLQQYEGKILISKNGEWFVIKNGVIYLFESQLALNKYQTENPQHAEPINLDFDAWGQYAVAQTGGVSNLAGY